MPGGWSMNEAIKMQISAFVDGELPDSEADLLLRRMSQDPELRRAAAEYLDLGRIMRGESSARGVERLRERIAAAIDDKVVEHGEIGFCTLQIGGQRIEARGRLCQLGLRDETLGAQPLCALEDATRLRQVRLHAVDNGALRG